MSVLIPANTRVEVHDLPKGMDVTVLAFDEDRHLLTPWPFSIISMNGRKEAAFIADDGIARWGTAADGADIPMGIASRKGCR